MAGSLPSQILGIKLDIPMPKIQGSCPSCGFRWEDFARTHRIGCPKCYEAHTQDLLPTLSRIQPGISHSGRRPQPSEMDLKNRLQKAKTELALAVKNEDFETAAALRDQIAELDTKVSVK
jgi:protein arginine kinase activator